MANVVEVDPDGDLLIILSLPTTPGPFAPWAGWDETISEHAKVGAAVDGEKTAHNEVVPFTTSTAASPESRFKVSSKHLCLVSRYFRKMLTGQWMEAITTYPDGCRHITIEVVDAEAFRLLMDVIHLRSSRIPKVVDLDMLAKIAVLVDYFECQEAVGIVSDMWIAPLRNTMAMQDRTLQDRTLILWIFIASVFAQPDIFETATRIAILESRGPIPTLGLPIRDKIIST